MKKLFVLLLSALMILCLAACGGKTDPTPSGSGTTDPGTSQQEPSNTPDEGSGENNNDEKNGLEKYGLTLDAITPANSTGSDVKEDTGSTYSLSFTMPETVTEDVFPFESFSVADFLSFRLEIVLSQLERFPSNPLLFAIS